MNASDGGVIDFSADTGRQLLYKIATKYDMPRYVKAAAADDLETKTAGASQCAVLAPTPALPCHSKAACWLSHAYYLEQRESVDDATKKKAEAFLAKRAAWWGIEDEVKSLVEREADLMKSAAETDEAFPVRNLTEAQQAADWLLKKYAENDLDGIDTENRIKLANRLVEATQTMGLSLPFGDQVRLERAAGLVGCINGNKLANKLAACGGAMAEKLAEAVRPLRGAELQSLHGKLAMACDKLSLVPSPAELGISLDEPVKDYVTMPSGAVYPAATVASCKSAAAVLVRTPVIGPPSKELVVKSAADASSDTLQQVDRLLTRMGVEPIAPPKPEPVSVLS